MANPMKTLPVAWIVVGLALLFSAGFFVSMMGLFRSAPVGRTQSGEVLRAPRPEELGRVMPAEWASPARPSREVSAVPGPRSTPKARGTHSDGSLVPSTEEIRKLQEEGGVVY